MRALGDRLVLASHNEDKLAEIRALLGPLGIVLFAAAALGLPEPEETGATFAENALLKAHAAAGASGLPALADDSGLTAAGLDGAPGILSARWAGSPRDFRSAMQRVHDELAGRFGMFARADRRATFVAVLALTWPDGEAALFEGRVEGRLVWPPRGTGGFGYDPIFEPEGLDLTFAEMAAAEKHALSHRGRALAKLRAALVGAA